MKKREMLILLLAYDVWAWSHKIAPDVPIEVSKLIAVLDEMPTAELLDKYKEKHNADFNVKYEVMCN